MVVRGACVEEVGWLGSGYAMLTTGGWDRLILCLLYKVEMVQPGLAGCSGFFCDVVRSCEGTHCGKSAAC